MKANGALSRRRPLGVYVIALLIGLRILDLFFETLRLQRGGLTAFLFPGGAAPPVRTLIILIAAISLLLLIIGLLSLKSWALTITTLLVGVNLAYGLWLYSQGRPQYLSLFATVLIAFYLSQRELQEAFSTPERHDEET